MAVIVSDSANPAYDGGLATVNGFYRAEAYNMGMMHGTTLALTSARTIPVTFANAGNCRGIVLAILSEAVTQTKSITVTLQENTGSWVDRATVTLTPAEILFASDTYHRGFWIVPFEGGTFPYAVTTDANTWRFVISSATGTTFRLMTSDGTNPFYVAWFDNAVSHSDGDAMIVKDPVTVDKTAEFTGILGTGATTLPTAIAICRSETPDVDNVCGLVWQNPAAAPYTMTVTDGYMLVSQHGGFRVGTATHPIKAANPASINFTLSTSGIRNNEISGMHNWYGRWSLFFYGDHPAVMNTTLASNASNGQKTITTTDATGWSAGDRIGIGRFARTVTTSKTFVIDTISDKTITLTENIDYARAAGGQVVMLDGSEFGIKLQNATTTPQLYLYDIDTNFVLSGVSGRHVYMTFLDHTYSRPALDVSANVLSGGPLIEHSALYVDGASLSYGMNGRISELGLVIEAVNFFGHVGVGPLGALTYSNYTSGVLKMHNCRCLDLHHGSSGYLGYLYNADAKLQLDIQNNIFENARSQGAISIGGINTIFKNNTFWGMYGNYGAVYIHTLLNPVDISGNSIDNCDWGLEIGPYPSVNALLSGFIFGPTIANTTDILLQPYAYIDMQLVNAAGILTLSLSNISASMNGSKLSFSTYNGTANDHRNYLKYGNIVSTGSGLTDTTVHTVGTGKFAIRFESSSSTNRLEWSFKTPTGNIATKTMTVAVWCKINNATYYAGTHQKPRLTIDYDNGTEVYAEAVAGTDWQLLSVTFAPTTAYGQITVTLSTMTDATGSDAYVYFDDMAVLYPAGYKLDLGGMDLWADALPITPPIATVLSAGDVWNLPASGLTGTGTIGQILNALVTGQYHFDKTGGIETIKDSDGNTVATFTVTDTATEVTKT